MTLFRAVLLTSGLVLVLCGGASQAQPANPAVSKPLLTLQMPALPDPVRVTLNPATTALLLLDFVEPICNSQPKCKGQMLPAMTPFMARARKAGMVVAYGAKGITTIIMVGWKVSGSVAYTSVGATVRDYTVVIPVDTTTATTDYETDIGFYQILNQGNGNLKNEPLKPKAPTLSRTNMISFE